MELRRTFLIAATMILGLAGLNTVASATAQQVLTVMSADGEKHLELTMDDLAALPQAEVETETVWTTPGKKVVFRGVLLRDVLKAADIQGGAKLLAKATNDYVVEIPAEDAQKYDVILASSVDGKNLDPADKGPLWVIYPYSDHSEINNSMYYSRAIWQLKEISVE